MSEWLLTIVLAYSMPLDDGSLMCVYDMDGRSYTITRPAPQQCPSQIKIDLRTMRVVAG